MEYRTYIRTAKPRAYNQTFLTLALAHGLDLPIINPNAAGMTGAVRAFHVLYNYDKSATDFIDTYSVSQVENKVDKPEQGIDLQTESLSGAIEKGFKNDTARLTTKLLKSLSPMDVINAHIIPALDRVGEAFDKGQLFLPQLIGAASAAQSAFEVIKVRLSSENAGTVSKGKIVLATVKGDIHDIGKNIVKVLLENYGYTVIDLGRDVDAAVVDAARWHGADIVGLSALMTTTLKAWRIQLLCCIKQCACKGYGRRCCAHTEFAKNRRRLLCRRRKAVY